MTDLKVRKRDGSTTIFDLARIESAIEKAFKEDRNRSKLTQQDKESVLKVAEVAKDNIVDSNKKIIHVEDIQDFVEMALMQAGHFSVAKKYILYRESRRQVHALQQQVVSNAVSFQKMFVDMQGMRVTKRNGTVEPVQFDKILIRITSVSEGLKVDPTLIAKSVVSGLYDGIRTEELDALAAQTAATMTEHYDYLDLAARVAISSLHKSTAGKFSSVAETLHKNEILDPEVYEFIKANKKELDEVVDYTKDFTFSYFGYKTLEKSYLIKVDRKIVERPQDLFMRVACGINMGDLESTIELYKCLSDGLYVHATPTLFNSGTRHPQMSSCFLVSMEDSIEGIMSTATECALISKNAGGIGLHIHNIRAKGSPIKGTNGISNGLVPMLQVFNSLARYVDQGGGKRKGSIAIYLEPWHADIEAWLDLRKRTGKEEFRARDLFYALWISDLFMKRVEADETWSLFCPNLHKGLADCYGEEFEKLYLKYEKEGTALKTIKARDLWLKILESQIEEGMPFICYKDAANKKSNQKNLGTIKSSNLCTEIMEYSNSEETAVCNLASLCLAVFVNKNGTFSFSKLHRTVKIAVKNLNRVIDRNFYPTEKTRRSNMRHRPIGLGVNGLADLFFKMDLVFDSEEAKQLNKDIFETIYHAALEASMELAKRDGAYETFEGSPTSKGLLQFDLWEVQPSDRYDWTTLKEKVKEHGLRNSLLVAPMPTASTSQIMGWNECIEPISSNLYKRETIAGEFLLINQYLIEDLERLGLWDRNMHDKILLDNGSVQNIKEIPESLKNKYKTAWEMSQRVLIDMAADRGAFICQSQSLNLFIAKPTIGALNTMHFYSWQKGLKTGQYYLRSKAAVNAQQVTTRIEKEEQQEALACSLENPEDCVMCSS